MVLLGETTSIVGQATANSGSAGVIRTHAVVQFNSVQFGHPLNLHQPQPLGCGCFLITSSAQTEIRVDLVEHTRNCSPEET